MPSQLPTEPVSRAVLLAALLFTAAIPACGDAGGAEGDENAGYFAEGADAPRVEVSACSLLTNEELAEQLYLSVRPSDRATWTSDEFDITSTEQDNGASRLCEYRFESRDEVGGGPVWHSDFTLMVFPSNAVAVPEDRRMPLEGAGPEMFRERGTEGAAYVVKGGLAATLSRFPGRGEEEAGGPDAGRVVLLRRIAERLP